MHILIIINDFELIANFKNNYQLNFISFVYIFRIKVKIVLMINI